METTQIKVPAEESGTRAPVAIEYHADDYGLFPEQSRRILRCHERGTLGGVSVMPNSDCLAVCMELLRPYLGEIAVTIHLNLIEGRSLCGHREVPLLTDPDGVFRVSFGGLLLHSFLPDRDAYRDQIKRELRAQITAAASWLEAGAALRLDGHAHYHMLPVVFDALMEVIREDRLRVSYIRIPRESPSIYLRHWRRLRDFSPINLVKVLILNILAERNLRRYGDYLNTLEQRLFLGVFLSGRMYRENVALILPEALRMAREQNRDIEILAHPGGVYEAEDIAKLTNANDVSFLTSENRRKEAAMYERQKER